MLGRAILCARLSSVPWRSRSPGLSWPRPSAEFKKHGARSQPSLASRNAAGANALDQSRRSRRLGVQLSRRRYATAKPPAGRSNRP